MQASYKEKEAPKTAEMSKEDRQKHLKAILKDAWASLDQQEQATWEAKAEEINKTAAASVSLCIFLDVNSLTTCWVDRLMPHVHT